jgi:hypothetical protein
MIFGQSVKESVHQILGQSSILVVTEFVSNDVGLFACASQSPGRAVIRSVTVGHSVNRPLSNSASLHAGNSGSAPIDVSQLKQTMCG